MDKREKVIKGLECIRDWSQFAVNKRWLVAGASEKMVQYAEDALELLKAQAPRVMTPTEIAALRENDIVWYEQHGPDGDYITAMVADGRESIGNASLGVRLKYLDENERLWTSRPTDEQRLSTPWEAVIR